MRLRVSIRSKLVEEGQDVLARRSLRLRMAGANVRRDFVDAYIEWRAHGGHGGISGYRAACKEYGISIALVMLLVEIAFRLLMYWWEHRAS